MKIIYLITSVMLCVAWGTAAHAQTVSANSTRTAHLDTLNRRTFTPAVHAPLRSLTPAAFLSASNGNSQAQIEAGFSLPNNSLLGALSVKVAATAPLTEGSTSTTLLAATGLSTGTKLSVSVGGIRWKFPPMENGRVVCRRLKSSGEIATSFNCEGNPMRWDLLPQGPREQIGRAIRGGPPVLYEITGSIAHDAFSFMDPVSFESHSTERTARSLGGDVGLLVSGTMLSAGVHYDLSYTPGTQTEICQPVGSTTTLRCRTGAVGAPAADGGTVFNAQIRHYLTAAVGTNPQVVYRPNGQRWSAELPVYFVSDGDGALIGGISPGYSSTGTKWSLRVFVGTAFGFRLR